MSPEKEPLAVAHSVQLAELEKKVDQLEKKVEQLGKRIDQLGQIINKLLPLN